ncbi:glycosyltransferase [Pseudoalteromonas mariniglutinosa]|uniref:glycosyltransferase n=1 Tax=Pseudoalteromonas mariniglutinosa TaxID=206042 RepID=UPI00384DFF88
MSKTNNFSIIIPAYNEEKLIANKLHQLARSLPKECTEVITVCNGCKDQTYSVAQNAINIITHSGVTQCNFLLVQLIQGCKITALNEGVKRSKNNTLILLDADIKILGSECAALVKILNSHSVMAASPKALFNFNNASWLVKKFYSTVSKSSYNQQHRIANVIALSPTAVDKLFPLPTVIADDAYIQRTITETHYHVSSELSYHFICPTTLLSTLKVQSRIIRGNLALKKRYPHLKAPKSYLPKLTVIDLAIFTSIKLMALTIAYIEIKLNVKKWHQDETSRK